MSTFTTGRSPSQPRRTNVAAAPTVPALPEPRGREVLRFDGEIDQLSVPAAAEQIFTRLDEARGAVVIDLSEVSFLCVDGLRALADAAERAKDRGIELRVFSGGARCVERGLRAAQLRHLVADTASDDNRTRH